MAADDPLPAVCDTLRELGFTDACKLLEDTPGLLQRLHPTEISLCTTVDDDLRKAPSFRSLIAPVARQILQAAAAVAPTHGPAPAEGRPRYDYNQHPDYFFNCPLKNRGKKSRCGQSISNVHPAYVPFTRMCLGCQREAVHEERVVLERVEKLYVERGSFTVVMTIPMDRIKEGKRVDVFDIAMAGHPALQHAMSRTAVGREMMEVLVHTARKIRQEAENDITSQVPLPIPESLKVPIPTCGFLRQFDHAGQITDIDGRDSETATWYSGRPLEELTWEPPATRLRKVKDMVSWLNTYKSKSWPKTNEVEAEGTFAPFPGATGAKTRRQPDDKKYHSSPIVTNTRIDYCTFNQREVHPAFREKETLKAPREMKKEELWKTISELASYYDQHSAVDDAHLLEEHTVENAPLDPGVPMVQQEQGPQPPPSRTAKRVGEDPGATGTTKRARMEDELAAPHPAGHPGPAPGPGPAPAPAPAPAGPPGPGPATHPQ